MECGRFGDWVVGLGTFALTETDRLPFSGSKDAFLYLVEYFSILFLFSAGLSLLIFGWNWGLLPALGAGILFLWRFRPRARNLPLGQDWPVADWNQRGREMAMFRVRYLKIALRHAGIRMPFVTLAMIVIVAPPLVATWINRRFF